jgi:magnesium chelatase family protein
MQASIQTLAFRGLEPVPVHVQVHLSNGLPNIAIVGLADKAVSESKERVRAALSSLGLSLPPKRIAVNLAPAIGAVAKQMGVDLPCGKWPRSRMGW